MGVLRLTGATLGRHLLFYLVPPRRYTGEVLIGEREEEK